VANARAFLPVWDRWARIRSGELDLPACAGSDAHFPGELGRAFCVLPPFRTASEFRAALPASRPFLRRRTGPWMHVASMATKVGRLAAGALPDPVGSGRRHRLEVAEEA